MGKQAQYRRQAIAGARRMADSIIATRSAPGFEQSADHPNVVRHLHKYSAAAFRLANAAQQASINGGN